MCVFARVEARYPRVAVDRIRRAPDVFQSWRARRCLDRRYCAGKRPENIELIWAYRFALSATPWRVTRNAGPRPPAVVFSAIPSAVSPPQFSRSTPNSSPLSPANVSVLRRFKARRADSCLSGSSPAICPLVSSTTLHWSGLRFAAADLDLTIVPCNRNGPVSQPDRSAYKGWDRWRGTQFAVRPRGRPRAVG